MRKKSIQELKQELKKLKVAEIGLERAGLLEDSILTMFNEWKDSLSYQINLREKIRKNTPNAALYLFAPKSNCD